MGVYFNPTPYGMQTALNSKIYVDKSGLISYTNSLINTLDKYVCVSRPRRFGKTIAANMLAAYYGKGYDSKPLFDGLRIAQDPSYDIHRNRYNVIFLNTKEFLIDASFSGKDILSVIQGNVMEDILTAFPGVKYRNSSSLKSSLFDIFLATQEQFIFIIDEWDCLVRETPDDKQSLRAYLHFLEDLLKDKPYVALTYITGILPVHKYGSQSALNMFYEFNMTRPDRLAEYVGFTENEVKGLCERYGMDFSETQRWYDGYTLDQEKHVYNPRSVVCAMEMRKFQSYWTKTETFESLRDWIAMNFDGLRDTIVALLAGKAQKVNTDKFANSFSDIRSRDDVLSLLIHLGYLGYIAEDSTVYIPNQEIASEFATAIDANDWREVMDSLEESEDLLKATWAQDSQAVAKYISKAHLETSILRYNSEESLSCIMSLAYYSARRYYTMFRELPAGEGFADLVFLPRPTQLDKPALIVELKWDDSADAAIAQIKRRQYPESLQEYQGNMLLIGISYTRGDKVHSCSIEEWTKL